MTNTGLALYNLMVHCACACKYCLLSACERTPGIDYERGEALARRMNAYVKQRAPGQICFYTVGYSYDYTQLAENIELNKSFLFNGYRFLQINGIGRKTKADLYVFLRKAKDAGAEVVDTTFFGLEDMHDAFAGRPGDFSYLLRIIKEVRKLGMQLQPTVVMNERNKEQLPALLELLERHLEPNSPIFGFVQDYRGKGEEVEELRLTAPSFEALPPKAQNILNRNRYQTETQWLEQNQWPAFEKRLLRLVLRPDNIDRLEQMSCREIIEELERLDEAYYAELPAMSELAARYGEQSDKLYQLRDLYWKWQKRYRKEYAITTPDMADERECGALRRQ